MTEPIGNTVRLAPGLIERLESIPKSIQETGEASQDKFTEIFSEMLNSVNQTQLDAAGMQDAFMRGDPVELHEMMIKAQEAGVALDLLLEVRNKLLSAYNEIMRMPI